MSEVCVHINSIGERENGKKPKSGVVCSGRNGDWGNANWGLCQRPTSVDKTWGYAGGKSIYKTGQCSCPNEKVTEADIGIPRIRRMGRMPNGIWWWDPYR